MKGTVGELGEFGLIRELTSRLTTTPAVRVGPGDDAAVVAAPDRRVVASTDILLEGRHFRRDWSTAYDVGRKAAAQNLLGRPTVHDRVPWFWSDQFDNKLLIVGLSQGHDQQVTRGDPAARSFTVCYLKGGELLAVEAVNHPKDYMAARKLIAERARPDPDKLADPQVAMKDSV